MWEATAIIHWCALRPHASKCRHGFLALSLLNPTRTIKPSFHPYTNQCKENSLRKIISNRSNARSSTGLARKINCVLILQCVRCVCYVSCIIWKPGFNYTVNCRQNKIFPDWTKLAGRPSKRYAAWWSHIPTHNLEADHPEAAWFHI